MSVDYDQRLHRVYAAGRSLAPEALAGWITEFERHTLARRPLTVLDLGSGIGRFSPALAEGFGGPVYGVEPSDRMRELAERDAAHPAVTYLAGSAEAIDLEDASVDLALLFFSLHHFVDRAAGLAELARVVRPGGTVLVRTCMADRMPDLHWYDYFPAARTVDAAMYPTRAELTELVGTAGFDPVELVSVDVERATTLRESYERLRLRALSTFEHLDEAETEAGFAAFAADVEADGDRVIANVPADLQVLTRKP